MAIHRAQSVESSTCKEYDMSEKKTTIQQMSAARGSCPVCGKPSYSATGTHPQCAVVRADALGREDRKKAAAEATESKRKSWTKVCPKCKHEVPARRLACDCGYKFVQAPFNAGIK